MPGLDLQAQLASPPLPHGLDGQALLEAWRDAFADALDAYRAWRDAPRDGASEAFTVYVAADDREAAAAAALACWIARSHPAT
jgi:hypothetical protein